MSKVDSMINNVMNDTTSLTGSNANSTNSTTYGTHLFTSKCCHAFNRYSGASCLCSQCNRTINQINDTDSLTISVKFNENVNSNVSGDLILAYEVKARRFATDPTYELCSMKCPKCNTHARYSRNPQGNLIFICSNAKCRHVFYDA